MITYLAKRAVLDGIEVDQARIDVDHEGTIVRAGPQASMRDVPPSSTIDLGAAMIVPGFVDAHSHAFQRGIRGATQRRGDADPSSFWSWREAMYQAANRLDPDGLHAISKLAFEEMRRSGITCVGEFHYVHHRPDGRPYDDENELSLQIVRAARDAGIRLVLLEVYYARAGAHAPPLPEQRRFCDGGVDRYLRRVEALLDRGIAVGIAPHSVRAVPLAELRELVAFAHRHALPIHTHLSEQIRENEECRAEYGRTPTEVFVDAGALQRPGAFTAVHAVHVTDDDRRQLARHNVCACPTTEADLGDGILGASTLRRAGTTLALGSDSNSIIDLVQEARLLEMHERLATQSRLRLCDADGRLGRALLDVATRGGATALGRADQLGTLGPGRPFDAAVIDLDHPMLATVPPDMLLDAVFTTGTAAVIREVFVAGRSEAP